MKLFDFNIDFLQKKFFKKQQTFKGDTRNTSDSHPSQSQYPYGSLLQWNLTIYLLGCVRYDDADTLLASSTSKIVQG
jgi:hypothetical protein